MSSPHGHTEQSALYPDSHRLDEPHGPFPYLPGELWMGICSYLPPEAFRDMSLVSHEARHKAEILLSHFLIDLLSKEDVDPPLMRLIMKCSEHYFFHSALKQAGLRLQLMRISITLSHNKHRPALLKEFLQKCFPSVPILCVTAALDNVQAPPT